MKQCKQRVFDEKVAAMIDRDGYRPNVGIILCNTRNQVFWAKRINQHAWQFPQGGIQVGESPEQAMYRELNEEVGLHPEHVRILGRTRNWLRYDVPSQWTRRDNRGVYRGQKQIWFLLRLTGRDCDVSLRASDHPEFDAWRWRNWSISCIGTCAICAGAPSATKRTIWSMDRPRFPRNRQSDALPGCGLEVQPGVPLWKLAPTRDKEGTRLCDFMVLIPRLKTRNALYIGKAQAHIAGVLKFHKEVVFANLDLNLNLLWVSHRYRRGLMLEILHAIRLGVPEAVLVAQSAPA